MLQNSIRCSAKAGLIFSGLLTLLIGCNKVPESSTAQAPAPSVTNTPAAQSSPAPSPTVSETASPDSPHPSQISAEGIGDVRLGMTLGQLKQNLGARAEFKSQSPFIVDFDAIAVSEAGKVQYYILHLAGQPLSDDDVIQGLLTNNPEFRTAEGVGPGSLIKDAETAYGKATLSYNTDNEAREYARFERQPAPNISFSTGNGTQEAAGIYPSPTGSYNETRQFKENAKIQSVLVVCLSESCAEP